MSDEGSTDGSFSSGYSSTDAYLESSSSAGPYRLSSPENSLTIFDKASASLEAAISASAAPFNTPSPGSMTEYFGITGSVSTPAGGIEIDAGLYIGNYGVGSFASFGIPTGAPGAFLGGTYGRTLSLAGDSIATSAGGSLGFFGASKGWSIDPTSGQTTGEQWSAGLSLGPSIKGVGGGGTLGYTTTVTTEFTSLYLSYVQFLNWIGYPGGSFQSTGF